MKGIPDFWLTALKNTDVFADMIKVRPSLRGGIVRGAVVSGQ